MLLTRFTAFGTAAPSESTLLLSDALSPIEFNFY
jgi:hypothetical protein